MPRYEYRCPEGETREISCSLAERNDPRACPDHGTSLGRLFSIPTIHWTPGTHPVRGTSWYEVHDRSPRELARDPNIKRYDPSRARAAAPKPTDTFALKQAWDKALATHGRPEAA